MNDDSIKHPTEGARKILKCDSGVCYSVVEYTSGTRVEIPINSDGSVRWFDDTKLIRK